jgi:adenylate cyclase
MMMKGMKKPLVFYSVVAIDMDKKTIRLNQTPATGPLLEIQIPLHCWIIHDKKLDLIPLAGTSLALDETCVLIETATAIEPLTDVKLNFDFCLEAHCFDDIYAKCTFSEPGKDNKHHARLHITSMAEKDRERIKEWMVQAS